MPPTLVAGQRSTGTLNTETRRVRDVTPALSQLEPDAGPLTTLLTKLRKKAVTDPKIEWFEDQLLPRFSTLTATLATGDATMTVNDPTYFRKGDIVRVNKSENVLVTATPTANPVSITRAFGEVAAAAAAVGNQLHILSNAVMEGDTGRSVLSTQRVPQYNYCQIVRDPWGLTGTAAETNTFAGKDWDEESSKQLIEHKKHLEYMFILGQRKELTTGTNPQRASRGIERFITTNVTDIGGTLTEALLDNFLRTAFRYGRKQKLGFMAPIVAQAINGFAKEKLKTVVGASSYGITLTRYENAGRVVLLHEHNLMSNFDLNDFSGIGGEMLLLDIEDIMARYVKGRFTVHRTNIQANDSDSRQDEYLSEVGLEAHQELKHGKLSGVTG